MKFRRTTWLIVGLVGFLIGLFTSRFTGTLHFSWVVLALMLAIATFKNLKMASLFTILLFGLMFGNLRSAGNLQNLKSYQKLSGQKVVLIGRAENDGVYSERAQLSFDLSNVKVIEPASPAGRPDEQTLIGKIGIEGFGAPNILRGDTVQVEGKLFKARGSRQARISYGELKVLANSSSAIDSFRRNFVASMQSSLPEPHASFGLGLLIGQRSTLPKDVLTILSIVGLTHIVAVSGYNLTIIVRPLRKLLGRFSKFQTIMVSFLLIGVFLLITGLSASIVRAAIVSGLSLLAWYYGRTIRPLLLLLIAAALTAGFNPLYIWFDIGWYLSFLAFFGVLILAPLLIKRFSKREPKTLTLILMESLCAWAMTAPIIIYIFHEVSIVALLANLIIVPLVPWAMLFSALAGLSGMLIPALSGWLAWPAKILLTYMLDIARILSTVPRALQKIQLTSWQMAGLYACLGLVSLILWRKTRAQNDIIPDTEIIN